MQKVKKFSALLVAVMMMLLVMTGCDETPSGGSPKSMFLQKLNSARRSYGYSSVVEDNDMDTAASKLLSWYVGYYKGQCTSSDVTYQANKLLYKNFYISHGTGYVNLVKLDRVSTSDFYNGNYSLSSSVTNKYAKYAGVAAQQYGGYMYLCLIYAY